MELDLQIYLVSCVKLYWVYSLAETPQLPSSPRIWAHKRGRLLVSLDRRHLFRTPWFYHMYVNDSVHNTILKRCLCQFSTVVLLFRYACKEREEPAACHVGICKLGTRAGFCGFSALNLCYRHQVSFGCSTYTYCAYTVEKYTHKVSEGRRRGTVWWSVSCSDSNVNDIEKESTNVSQRSLGSKRNQ
jgi:hypothetical protein